MTDSLYQLVLDHIRTGKPEADLMACGCMGCMNRVNGICACEQAGYSPNGVRRPCKCSCQLPQVAERNRQKREKMAGYVARARAELKRPAIGMWWAECCIHDLEQITAESDLEGIQESLDETGAGLWPDLELALQALERGGWGDDERAIADRLRSEVKP